MEIKSSEPSRPELLGANNWEDLLDPLHLSVRRYILRCGDLCQATYDSFNSDTASPFCGSCRYGKRDFFDKVSFPELDFAKDHVVHSFLYATAQTDDVPPAFLLHSLSREAWSKESNWIGYIAVSTDAAAKAAGRREIYVAWRGTIRNLEWIDVLKPKLVPMGTLHSGDEQNRDQHHWYDGLLGSSHNDGDGGAKVMEGWHTIYNSSDQRSPFNKKSARDQLLIKLKELIELYQDEDLSLTFVGHSLGACLAVLSAFDVVENGLSKIGDKAEFPVCAVVFGCPQVGNKAFNERLKKLPGLRVLHVRNEIDIIPHYPSKVLGYVHSGVDLVVDTRKSSYLKDSKNPSDWHNLQALLHVVAAWGGKEGEFGMKVKRSVALVNKSCGFLKEECLVPESWWVEKNKGMVIAEDGEWRLAAPEEEDVPVPEM